LIRARRERALSHSACEYEAICARIKRESTTRRPDPPQPDCVQLPFFADPAKDTRSPHTLHEAVSRASHQPVAAGSRELTSTIVII
jgi:hypothetical protein